MRSLRSSFTLPARPCRARTLTLLLGALLLGALLLGALLLGALLLIPATAYAQQPASPAGPPPAEAGRSVALPASPGALLLDAPALEADVAAVLSAQRQAARLRPGGSNATAAPAVQPGAAAPAEARAPTGNARFPAWNLPLRSGQRFSVYGNVAYGNIDAQYNDGGERVDLSNPIPTQQLDLTDVARLLQLDTTTANSASEFITADVRVPGRISGEVNTVNLNLGAIYNVYSNPFFDLGFGLDFQASQQNFSADRVTLNVAGARGDLTFVPAFLQIPEVENLENGSVSEIAQELRDVNQNSPLNLTIPPDEQIPSEVTMADDRSIESGFQTQALTAFLRAQNRLLSVRAGFQFDLGSEPNLGEGEREVSDRQNAVLLGFTGSYPATEALRVYAGADGWFTLESERDVAPILTVDGEAIPAREDVSYDEGNTYAAQVGAAYSFLERFSVGAGLTFRYRTAGTLDGEEEGSSGYHLGVAPYLNYAPPGAPFSLYLKGGVRDEYREFSFSLLGENEFAPRAGATLGAVYRL